MENLTTNAQDQSEPQKRIEPYANLIVRLLQNVIYEDNRKHWQELISYQHQIRHYFAVIGIELIINEAEGYAFLSQPDEFEGEISPVSRLVRRMPLTYEQTLLLIILREALEEFDVQNTDTHKLFLTNRDMRERIEVFFGERSDEIKLLEKLEQIIKSVADLGFLKEVEVQQLEDEVRTFEVKRIVKAKINSEKLEEIKSKLAGLG